MSSEFQQQKHLSDKMSLDTKIRAVSLKGSQVKLQHLRLFKQDDMLVTGYLSNLLRIFQGTTMKLKLIKVKTPKIL